MSEGKITAEEAAGRLRLLLTAIEHSPHWKWERENGVDKDLRALLDDRAALQAEIDSYKERNAEVAMLAHRWMVAHDKLAAGEPYDFPAPADLPEAVAALQAGRDDAMKALEAASREHVRDFERARKAEASLAARDALLKEVGEALEPFAEAVEGFEPGADYVGDYRRAASALQKIKGVAGD